MWALTAVTLGLVALSAVAFVRTQMLKQEEVPVAGIDFDKTVSPGCGCPDRKATLSFVIRRAQPLTATMVTEEDEPVRTLLDAALRASGRETIAWDGRDDAGRIVPEGEYRLELDLAVPDRTVVIPTTVNVRLPDEARQPGGTAIGRAVG